MSELLLDNVDADTTSDEFKPRGGPALLIVRGDDFGGGTVTFEIASVNDALNRFTLLTGGSFTANGNLSIDRLPIGSRVRAVLAGATNPDNVYVELLQ